MYTSTNSIEGAELVTHHKLIVIPKTLQNRIVAWYHYYLAHPGMTRLEATLRETMTWPSMRKIYYRMCARVPNAKSTKEYALSMGNCLKNKQKMLNHGSVWT
jgi:hypothetical protein